MKKNLIYIFILLSVMACLDDKSNYDYKDLNDFENWDRNGEVFLRPGRSPWRARSIAKNSILITFIR